MARFTKFFKEIKWFHVLMLTVAGIVNAIGITIFLSPVKLYDSGIRHFHAVRANHTGIAFSFNFFADFKCSDLSVWAEKARRRFYGQCSLHGMHLLLRRLVDH